MLSLGTSSFGSSGFCCFAYFTSTTNLPSINSTSIVLSPIISYPSISSNFMLIFSPGVPVFIISSLIIFPSSSVCFITIVPVFAGATSIFCNFILTSVVPSTYFPSVFSGVSTISYPSISLISTL